MALLVPSSEQLRKVGWQQEHGKQSSLSSVRRKSEIPGFGDVGPRETQGSGTVGDSPRRHPCRLTS